MNFLPECKGRSPDYWCTWETQNCLAEHDYDEKSVLGRILSRTVDPPLGRVRAMINETTLFGETDLIHQFPEVRASLFLMLDDGWDLPFSVDRSKTSKLFGSLMLNEERFPSCVGSPEERLKKLNDMVKAEGWRGIGIWVCAQSAGDNYRAPFDDTEEHRAYWRERIEMCREADVRYWKVDWGTHCFNAGFRKMLTDMAHEIFPPLFIEHASPCAPINGRHDDGQTRFAEDEKVANRTKVIAEQSDVFRSYDVTPGLSATTTLDRVQFLLQHTGGIVNCEDELYIGAALGCSLGVMRSKFTQNQRMDEVTAAIRWHAITPAFAGGAILTSTECKEDSFYFDESATWYSPAHGKTVVQSAPCIVARNAPLPTVTGEHLPYVLLSKSPDGNYGIGAIPVSSDVKSTEPPCVSFAMDAGEFLGIFGWFEQVSVTLKAPPKKAYIQSLVRGEARELTLDGDRLTVDLAMLRSLYSSIDGSDSAVAVHFEY